MGAGSGVGGAVSSIFGPADIQTPPPGIPRLYWQKILADPKNGALVSYIKSGQGKHVGSDGKFYANADKAFHRNGRGPREILQALTATAQAEWKATDPEQQKVFVKNSDAGLKYDPTSTQGINEQQLADATARRDAAMASSAQAEEAQKQSLFKLQQQSDPNLTAEDKFKMAMDQKASDADYQGKVGAITRDMQARGMSGAGSELTKNLAGASDAANRHAMTALGTRADAQKRAMDSLGKASDLSSQMRNQSIQQAQIAGDMNREDTEFDIANRNEGIAAIK